MSWQTLSLHFKQTYDGAYRYLDKCGEFMLSAVKEMDFIPGEIKPVGANLEMPERGLKVGVDALELVVTQELPGKDEDFFIQMCVGLADLATKHFEPVGIIRNGFASKSMWPMSDPDLLLATSLKFGGDAHVGLGKLVGMVPAHKRVDCNFTSGSLDLHVLLHPVTFEKVSVSRHTPSFKSSQVQKQRAQRLNKSADRFATPLNHALMLEVDLIEVDPPENVLKQHFSDLKRHTDALRKEFTVS